MFRRMTIYTVHLQPEKPLQEQKPLFIKEGFNICAFLLPLVWALYHRMWFVAVLFVGWAVLLLITAKSGLLPTQMLGIIDFGMHIIIGFSANDWLRRHLTSKGYVLSDVAVADSLLRAEQRYFERCVA